MADDICTIDGCPEPQKARTWCSAHYSRWKRHGDPLGGGSPRLPLGTLCKIEGCGDPARTRGWCRRHYQIWLRRGDAGFPTRYTRRGTTLAERLELRILKTGKCWFWTGSMNSNGYGTFKVGNKTKLAHRLSYEEFVGPIPEGLVLDHLCRNRACVNPDHLEPVTQLVNVQRGASTERKSHCSHGHEFTPENTRWIRHCVTCNKESHARSEARRGSAP